MLTWMVTGCCNAEQIKEVIKTLKKTPVTEKVFFSIAGSKTLRSKTNIVQCKQKNIIAVDIITL